MVNPGSGAARSLHGFLTFTLGTAPPRMCGDLLGPRDAVWTPREGSPDVRGRQLPGARPRFRGFENFPARVPWRRAAAEPDPRGRASRGELSASRRRRVTLAFRRASPWAALRPPAPSLLARTVPAPPLGARSARPGRGRRRPSPPPPPSSPARRPSEWPSLVPRPDSRRASAAPARAAGSGEETRRERPEEAAPDFSPMVHSDMSKSPPSAAAAVAQELQMDVLESAAPAGALGAPAQVATAPRLRLPL